MSRPSRKPTDTLGFVSERLCIERSEFFACLRRCANIDEYKDFLKAVRAAYPKARHYPSARLFDDDGAISAGSTDDGEPSGTAGRQILAVLTRHCLSNTAIIVARYFGGKKLGAGGLTRAYANAADMVAKAYTEGN
ncbi:MAG: YigZ family protein [Oscillospiraceae bacterium]|nr:YigZ family protein [Oscillospiraceae bacterium]